MVRNCFWIFTENKPVRGLRKKYNIPDVNWLNWWLKLRFSLEHYYFSFHMWSLAVSCKIIMDFVCNFIENKAYVCFNIWFSIISVKNIKKKIYINFPLHPRKINTLKIQSMGEGVTTELVFVCFFCFWERMSKSTATSAQCLSMCF